MRPKKRIGRPPKKIRLDVPLHIMFTAGNYDKLERLAMKMRLPVAVTARNIILDRLDGLNDL